MQSEDDKIPIPKVLLICLFLLFSGCMIYIYIDYRRERKKINDFYEQLRKDIANANAIAYEEYYQNRNSPKIVIEKQHCPIKTYTDKKRIHRRYWKTVTLHTEEEWRVWFRRLDNGKEFMLNVNRQQFEALQIGEKIDTIK